MIGASTNPMASTTFTTESPDTQSPRVGFASSVPAGPSSADPGRSRLSLEITSWSPQSPPSESQIPDSTPPLQRHPPIFRAPPLPPQSTISMTSSKSEMTSVSQTKKARKTISHTLCNHTRKDRRQHGASSQFQAIVRSAYEPINSASPGLARPELQLQDSPFRPTSSDNESMEQAAEVLASFNPHSIREQRACRLHARSEDQDEGKTLPRLPIERDLDQERPRQSPCRERWRIARRGDVSMVCMFRPFAFYTAHTLMLFPFIGFVCILCVVHYY